MKCDQRAQPFHLYPIFSTSDELSGWEKRSNERTSENSAYCLLRNSWRQLQEKPMSSLFSFLPATCTSVLLDVKTVPWFLKQNKKRNKEVRFSRMYKFNNSYINSLEPLS